ncbi:MAG: Glyoxalase/bleomycin resistance protein/dioxygenase [Actinomycetia bacterium]|nr:Glyoxalase/bleomycin resistance protein/dioxygenase [Actinomycetes bacterium]
MPALSDVKPGAPIWIDLMTSDVDASRAFYSALFGWESTDPDPDTGGYFNFLRNGQFAAGGMSNPGGPDMPDTWNLYLKVDDAKATVAAAEAAGGTVIVPAMDVGTLGSMGVFVGVGGAVIGLWQPKDHTGFAVRGEAGTPSWFELQTHDYDKTLDFYRDVFKWDTVTMADEPEFHYTFSDADQEQAAGVGDDQFLGDDEPSRWSIYFGSDDVDASIAKAVDLGATVVSPAEDTPYGRLATLADPTGAIFKLRG